MNVGEPISDFRPSSSFRSDSGEPPKRPSRFKKKGVALPSGYKLLFAAGIALLVIVLAAVAGYFYLQYTDLKKNPNSVAEETTKELVTSVSELYDLPDEKPTVALINNKEKLKDQAFFDKAKNGDYLLIYTNAKLALIYRKETNKIINVGPIAITSEKDKKKSGSGTESTDSSDAASGTQPAGSDTADQSDTPTTE